MSRRWVAAVAVAGTALIGVGAFWLSFRALSDLAGRAGVPADQGWVWAAIVDGVIVTSTVAAVALDRAGWRATWFAWLLLAASAGVSVVANVVHAIVAADGAIDPVLVGAIAAVPPLVLLAMTHLTVVVVRHAKPEPEPGPDREAPPADIDLPEFLVEARPVPQPGPALLASSTEGAGPRRPRPALESTDELRARAAMLRHDGQSLGKIAAELGVHKSTVSRWFLPGTSVVRTPEGDADE